MANILERLTTALADRYTVHRQVGEGGMATVYVAEDRKHKRQVAIKVLRPELAAAIGGERFLREIELAAGLQHPHIVPVYDSGQADGLLYYVMPFVEGESLRQYLKRTGPLPVEEAIRLVTEAASALSYAHEHGIIHRDIKPDNIMLSGGHAVVADFGIAKAIDAAAEPSANLTGSGLAVGTPAYMSPEQATAESDIDERSDEYSLACVLYECLTGGPPFTGRNTASIITQAITAPRPHPRVANRDLPVRLDDAVVKAMALEPADRYATVAAFASALRQAQLEASGGILSGTPRWALGLAAITILLVLGGGGWWLGRSSAGRAVVEGAESIAVMPFNVTGQDVAFMGEGMVDLLSTNLDGIEGINTVEPRTVLKRWNERSDNPGGGADLQTALEIAGDVHAGSVLLGSIVAAGSRVRISADLYARDGSRLARAQVEGAGDSVLSLVDDLSLSLTREIWRSSKPLPSLRVAGLTTNSLEAMQSYLTGARYYRQAMWDSAAASFKKATDIDSTFALAHFRRASALGWIGGFNTPGARTATRMGMRYADRLPPRERALVVAYDLFSHGRLEAIDSMRAYVARYPDDPDGWYLLGESQFHTRGVTALSPAELEKPFDRVLQLEPSLTAAAIHPLELSISGRDRERYQRYLDILDQAGATEEADNYRAAGAMVFNTGTPATGLGELFVQRPAAGGSVLLAAITDPEATSETILETVRSMASAFPEGNPAKGQYYAILGILYSALGQLEAATELADSLQDGSPNVALVILSNAQLAGYGPPGYAQPWTDRLVKAPASRNPYLRYYQALYALTRADTTAADTLIAGGLALDTITVNRPLRALLEAAQGWRMMVAGDTAGGVQRLRDKLSRTSAAGPTLSAPLRLQLALALAAGPTTRAEGIRRLRYGFANDVGYIPIIDLAIGRAAEAGGDRETAIDAYRRFLHLWDHADAELQGQVEEARLALARLASERG